MKAESRTAMREDSASPFAFHFQPSSSNLHPGQTSIPAMHADVNAARLPATIARSPSAAMLALAARGLREVYPYFSPDDSCRVCELAERRSGEAVAGHAYRVFLPPGYHENTLERLPVIYMQDGQNLFFAEEAFGGAAVPPARNGFSSSSPSTLPSSANAAHNRCHARVTTFDAHDTS